VVEPIPEGYHSITPYVVVNNGVQAIEFYKRAFGAIEKYRRSGPDGKTIINAELRIGNSPILLSDEFLHEGGAESCRSPKSIGRSAVTIHIY
jgi:PhnB protein